MIEVLRCSPHTLVQDLGRPGLAGLGVSRSGAADRSSFALANRLVGNAPEAAALEVTLGGLSLRFGRPVTVAVTGAEVELAAPGVSRVGLNCPFDVIEGSVLELGIPPRGLRSYVAIRGGLDAPIVLSSRATDVLSGIGPAQLEVGNILHLADLALAQPIVDLAPVPAPPQTYVLDVMETDLTSERLFGDTSGGPNRYTIGENSNRIGLRLIGRPLLSARPGDTGPQGLVPGAVQIPPDGQPVIFLADHPVTGGYPVAGVLTQRSIDAAAQMRPGDVVELRSASTSPERR